jgi:mono/diheme cytochrome c family protein
MKHLEVATLGPLMLAAMLIIGATVVIGQTETAAPQPETKASPKTAHTAAPDRGQQVFAQNCSRCHTTPEGFPPSISGTVARHMRVRAGLSDADYKALRQFLNP